MPHSLQLFVVHSDKETSALCQIGGKKLGRSLGSSVSLSETLTASTLSDWLSITEKT